MRATGPDLIIRGRPPVLTRRQRDYADVRWFFRARTRVRAQARGTCSCHCPLENTPAGVEHTTFGAPVGTWQPDDSRTYEAEGVTYPPLEAGGLALTHCPRWTAFGLPPWQAREHPRRDGAG